jgi:hypothetical protein
MVAYRSKPAVVETGIPRGAIWQRGVSLAIVPLVAGLLSILKPGPAIANEYDDARAQHPALFEVYYDRGLLEYCGLVTRESAAGFFLRRDELLAEEPLTEEQHRRVRVAAGIAIDYQYQDHGLGGQRQWCNTAGRDAYNRFIGRYLARPGTNTNSGEAP